MKSFNEASYLAQVRRLRVLAGKALRRFPIRVKSVRFINHGENATFKVQATDGKCFLLRVHRAGYHSDRAIQEELAWLRTLSNDRSLIIPIPVRSKQGNWIESVITPEVGTARQCCLLQWIEGRFIRKSLKPSHLFEIGVLLGRLHDDPPKHQTRHRRYWRADGLLGERPTFGSLDSLSGVTARQQRIITQFRKRIYARLRAYEKTVPRSQGQIHADLHFGNVLVREGTLGAIDFDDCGFGFYVYDLVPPLLSAESILGPKRAIEFSKFKAALIAGYSSQREWTKRDNDILTLLISARKLTMLGWLNARSDNPRLKKYFGGAVKRALNHIRSMNS